MLEKEINLQETIEKSGLFDKIFYLKEYHDVRISDMTPIEHYISYGIKEDRKPNLFFDPTWYRNNYKDIENDDIPPFIHYILFGKNENRSTHNPEQKRNVKIANVVPTVSKEVKGLEFSTVDEAFDSEYYYNIYTDIKIAGINALEHYLGNGWKEGRMPNEWFDPLYYIEKYDDVKKEEIEPLEHFIKIGQFENRITKYTPEVDSNSFKFQFTQNNNKSEEYIEYEDKEKIETDIKLIAYYLPQFHPIIQNDKSWGKGFTEWTNVTKAIPQFHEHYQPRLAGELGYYDLRMIEIQKRQIELAKNYGLHGFCYHYYWFDGQKVMDKPLQQILDNPDLDFPFCINWANENWTKRWDGLDNDVILAQNHTKEDDLAFIETISHILKDKRYIRIDGKPLLMVYRPKLFPDILNTVSRWRKYARENGIGELYLVLSHAFEHINPIEIGFDAAAEFAPNSFQVKNVTNEYMFFNEEYEGQLYDYESAIDYSISYKEPTYTKFRSLCPSWDNEARKPGKGTSFVKANPNTYSKWLEYILYNTEKNRQNDEKLIFINAWNEWAEGAYLEPDRKYGYAYLDKTYNQIKKFTNEKLYLINQSKQNTKQNDTAVILHLFYIDLWEEMKSKLVHLNNQFDLYVNINNNCDINFLKKVKKDFPFAKIYSCENRGRDILPFIEMMQDILPLDYKYICKIHTKKSFHRTDGDHWRNHLIDSLLISKERIKEAKDYLDQNIGIVVAKDNIFSYRDWVGSNEDTVNAFARKANIEITEDFYFPAGSMFWFKPEVFRKLIENIDLREFVFENGQIDGTIAHALERIVGLLCDDLNLRIEEI